VKFDLIIIRYGELALKAPYTRKIFEQRLLKNITSACDQMNMICSIDREWGRFYITTSRVKEAVNILSKIFGVSSFSPALKTSANMELIAETAIALMGSVVDDQQSFAVRVQRTGDHPFTSLDVARQIGKRILESFPLRVDLTHPDIELSIEVRNNNAYVFIDKFRGPGGMPQGTQGRILGYISSDIDILASWYLLKRGCSVVFFIQEERMNKKTNAFLRRWFIPEKIISYDAERNLLSQLHEIIATYRCSAMVQGLSFSEGENKILEEIKTINSSIDVPLLLPLIAMSRDDIRQKADHIGLDL
jgi:thiamine biosynthesis protein ThiI